MSKREEYRAYAVVCFRTAECARSRADKDRLVELGKRCMKLAEHIERGTSERETWHRPNHALLRGSRQPSDLALVGAQLVRGSQSAR